jgi:hypothetical protein
LTPEAWEDTMAKSRTTVRSRKKVQLTPETIKQALEDLDINVPYYDARLVGNRIEFHLYGGQVRTWPGGK